MNENNVKAPTKVNDYNFDPSLFIPMESGLEIDKIYSEDCGLMRGTNYIIIGDPGVGKTTIVLRHISELQNKGYKVLYVNSEMTLNDMAVYTQRFPEFGEVETYFVKDLLREDMNIVDQLDIIFQKNYDVIAVDSLAELLLIVQSEGGNKIQSSKKAEKWFLDVITSANIDNYTSFLIIQQVTKNGNFVGTNKINHNTTGMMEMRWDNNNERYMYFTKNRRGGIDQRMYFTLTKNKLAFDINRFNNDIRATEMLRQQSEIDNRNEINFDNYFNDDFEIEDELQKEISNMKN